MPGYIWPRGLRVFSMAETGKEMSFMEHLEELRWTLMRSAFAVVTGMIVAFCFKQFVFDTIILAPQRPDFITYRVFCWMSHRFGMDQSFCMSSAGFTIMNTKMGGQFMTHITVSFTLGAILAMPYVLWEIWRFIRPGLKQKERNSVRGVVFYASLLFMLGVVFGYYVLAPLSVQFLGPYSVSASVNNLVDLDSYIGTVTSLTLWTGVVFELPMVVLFMARIGIIGPDFLRTYRKHAFVIILIIAAIITPPDVTSQILVTLPLMALYEVSIFLAARAQRGKERVATTAVTSVR